jgi:hypothetical protein
MRINKHHYLSIWKAVDHTIVTCDKWLDVYLPVCVVTWSFAGLDVAVDIAAAIDACESDAPIHIGQQLHQSLTILPLHMSDVTIGQWLISHGEHQLYVVSCVADDDSPVCFRPLRRRHSFPGMSWAHSHSNVIAIDSNFILSIPIYQVILRLNTEPTHKLRRADLSGDVFI